MGNDARGWRSQRIKEWARRLGGSDKTVERNEDHVETFFLVLEDLGYGHVPPSGVTDRMVERFKDEARLPKTERNVKHGIAGRPMAPHTVANALPHVRLFCQYYQVKDHDGDLLADQTKYRRLWRMTARPESVYATFLDKPAQLRALLNAAAQDKDRGLELQAMMALFGPVELRLEAALSRCPSDFSLTLDPRGKSTVTVVRGKFGKPQQVEIPPHVVPVLMLACQDRAPMEPVWRWSVAELRRRFVAALGRAGKAIPMPKRVTPHTLRKSVAAFGTEAGCKPGFVQRRLNHSDWATTQRYYQRPDPKTDSEDMAKLDAYLREG